MARNCDKCVHNSKCIGCLEKHRLLRKIPFLKCKHFAVSYVPKSESNTICDSCDELEKCIESKKVIDIHGLEDQRAHYMPSRIVYCEKYMRKRYESNY